MDDTKHRRRSRIILYTFAAPFVAFLIFALWPRSLFLTPDRFIRVYLEGRYSKLKSPPLPTDTIYGPSYTDTDGTSHEFAYCTDDKHLLLFYLKGGIVHSIYATGTTYGSSWLIIDHAALDRYITLSSAGSPWERPPNSAPSPSDQPTIPSSSSP